MKFTVIITRSEEGCAVSCPSLPGCHSQGRTETEALKNIQDAIFEYLETVAMTQGQEAAKELIEESSAAYSREVFVNFQQLPEACHA